MLCLGSEQHMPLLHLADDEKAKAKKKKLQKSFKSFNF